jgi:hypothetical protein
MRVTKIALAVAGLCAAAAATAAPNANRIALSAGASAVQANVTTAVRNLCTNGGGVPTTFAQGNFTTVVCADVALTAATYASKPNADFRNFAGLPFAEFRLNVANGSFGSVQILNGVAFNFRDPASAAPFTPVPAPAGAVVIGGISDVETNRFPIGTIGTNVLAANTGVGVAQTFGVAVSSGLYAKMFAAQQAAGLIPPSCTLGSTNISYCIPSISKAQFATIMANNEFNAAYSKGVGFLTGVAADETLELRYARRVDTSGTQAAKQNYFLGLPCSLSPLSVVPEPVTDAEPGGLRDALIGQIRVLAAPGTGDVRNELNRPGAFTIGVMSGENNQTGQSWQWLRLDGAAIGENSVPGSAGITNSNTLRDGTYSFYYEATYTGGNATNDGYWATISAALNTLAAPVGLVNKPTLEGGFNKGGLTCLGSTSN